MTIEEKARRYDEALKNAKDVYTYYCDDREQLRKIESIFPELKESKDEKIRKELVRAFESLNTIKVWNGIERTDILAWLEKQGEQKPIMDIPSKEVIFSIWDLGNEWRELTNGRLSEKYGTQLNYIQKHWHESEYYLKAKQNEQKTADVVRSFKVGDWIVGPNNVVRVTSLNDELNCYIAVTPNNEEVKIPYYFDDGQGHTCAYHLWSIKDAKDGDVLCLNNEVFIFSYKKQKYNIVEAHCYVDSAGGFYLEGDFLYTEKGNSIYPATKEQRKLFFQKMEEAGYKWDTNNKQLIKLL